MGAVVLVVICCGLFLAQKVFSPRRQESGQPKNEADVEQVNKVGRRIKPGRAKGASGYVPDVERVKEVEQLMKQKGYSSIPLERVRAGYLTVQVTVAGQKLRLVLDTGAPRTVLDPERVKAANLEWKTISSDRPGGNNTGPETWELAKIDGIDFEGFKTGALEVGVHHLLDINNSLGSVGDPPVDGLLGGNVLTAYSARIDYETLRLFLRSGE
jgi:hypothetical protein